MKQKTSITLSPGLLQAVDELAGEEPRSAVIERALREYVDRRAREERDARELERINAAAERLNAEAAEVLEYQAPIHETG